MSAAFHKASLASSHACLNICNCVSTDGNLNGLADWCTLGICPRMSSNGAFFVVAFGHEFNVYCASGRSKAQFCW